VWDPAGNVVTNAHVVSDARSVVVRTASGDTLQADVIGVAPNYDLAVVRIISRGSIPAAVAIGSSADLKVGQWVFAVGNPFGLDQTLTTGVISALKRRIPTTTGREISDVIQTDAAINPGNSGGPLLDSAGRLIGVTTAIVSPSVRTRALALRSQSTVSIALCPSSSVGRNYEGLKGLWAEPARGW
jgi:2-alkenal reductase